MSTGLNNISLPPQLLADLYQHVLVQDTARPVPVPFLGNNGKNILIVVNNEAFPFLPDGELAFLTTVFSACALDLSHVAIVNWHLFAEKSPDILLHQLKPHQILLLGVAPSELDFPQVEKYVIKKFHSLSFVAAPSLSVIQGSTEEKKGLWSALKKLFGI